MFLKHAQELGANVVQGAYVNKVLFEGDRAVGVLATVAGKKIELRSKFVVDASGRRTVIGKQLGLREKDPQFNQFAIYSWFKGVKAPTEKTKDYIHVHFLPIERGWVWHIPIYEDATSVGVVVEKKEFQKSGKTHEEFFNEVVQLSKNTVHALEGAERIRPFWIEADYSYKIEKFTGPGWMLVGDAARFVDPIFSSGVSVAMRSSQFAFAALEAVAEGRADRGRRPRRVRRNHPARHPDLVRVDHALLQDAVAVHAVLRQEGVQGRHPAAAAGRGLRQGRHQGHRSDEGRREGDRGDRGPHDAAVPRQRGGRRGRRSSGLASAPRRRLRMTEHQLLLLLAEIVVLVVAARLGGEVAARLGIPLVVGELLFGIALGPSLLGALWPGGFDALFPAEQRPLLDVAGWIGVIFLVLIAGMETRLGILRRARKAVFTSWIGGFFFPFALGVGFAFLVPEGSSGRRLTGLSSHFSWGRRWRSRPSR